MAAATATDLRNRYPLRPALRVDDLVEILELSRPSVYEGLRNGELPSYRIGRRILVPTAAVLRDVLGFSDHEIALALGLTDDDGDGP